MPGELAIDKVWWTTRVLHFVAQVTPLASIPAAFSAMLSLPGMPVRCFTVRSVGSSVWSPKVENSFLLARSVVKALFARTIESDRPSNSPAAAMARASMPFCRSGVQPRGAAHVDRQQGEPTSTGSMIATRIALIVPEITQNAKHSSAPTSIAACIFPVPKA